MQKKKKISSATVQPKAKVKAKAQPVPSTPSDVEYQQLFDTCVVSKHRVAAVDKIIDEKVLINRSQYDDIATMVQSGGSPESIASFGSAAFFKPRSVFSAFPGYQQPQPVEEIAFSPDKFFQPGNPFRLPDLSNTFTFKNPQNPFSFGFTKGNTIVDLSMFATGRIPWYFIACVHYLECSFSFKRHLHNGDPLTGYTVQVPAGRPKVGHPPPFTFSESAVDALKFMGFDKVRSWVLPFILRKLEAYNGFGYFKYRKINSPYLWSFSNHYTKGKYVKDGKYDKDAVSQQTGSAVILKRMEERGLIYIPRF